MDATHLALLVNDIISKYPDMNLLSVHDCFGTSANSIKILKNLVISSFIKIYGNKYFISELHNFFIIYIKRNFKVSEDNKYVENLNGELFEIPEKPKLGKLEIANELMKSTYFIN